MFRRLFPLGLSLVVAPWFQAQTTPPAVDLFADQGFAGWTLVSAESAKIDDICTRTNDGVRVAGATNGYLLTDADFENYQLHLEYRWPADAAPRCDSGVLLNVVAPAPTPTCIQLQTKSRYAGDLLQMGGASFAEPVTSPAKFNLPPILSRQNPASEFPYGEWNVVDVVCQNGAIEVRINGVLQNQVTSVTPRAGRIGIQLEGAAFELRNVRVSPLPAS